MIHQLQDFGLSENEAKVYSAALVLGRATADQLSKQAKVKRPTTYVQLESLMGKGLMSTYEENKKTYFAPESPELLKRLLLKQKDELENKERDLARFLPDLLHQFEGAGERPVVRFFPGKEGITAVREEMLFTKERRVSVIFNPKLLLNMYSSDYLDQYSDKRRALGIFSRGLYVNSEMFSRAGEDSLTERRMLPSQLIQFGIDIYVYDDKVGLVSLEGVPFGLVIQSAQISLSIKAMFEFLWNLSASTE